MPFFSLLVKDIYFLHQGMSDRDDRGFVRFAKCMSHARLVSQILGYKDRVVSEREGQEVTIQISKMERKRLFLTTVVTWNK